MLLLLAAGAVLGGCGSGDGTTTDTTRRTAVTQPRSTTTEADPVAAVVDREKSLTAIKEQIQLLERADWAGAWAALHPAQQAVVGQSTFATCAAKRWGPALDVTEVHLVSVGKSQLDVPGTSEKGPGHRAVFRIVGTDPGGAFDATTTYLVFDVGGARKWTLADPAAYQGGACPPDNDTLI